MAALTFLACSVLAELWEFADAFRQSDYNLVRTLQRLRIKKRRLLFRQYCRAVWQQEALVLRETRLQVAANKVSKIDFTSVEKSNAIPSVEKMQRDGIDFAAIEATALAYEAIDAFSADQPRRSPYGGGNDELDHRYNLELMENYNDIEVIDANEINNTFYEYADAIPVLQRDIGILNEGMSFLVTGYVLKNCERFSINFVIENNERDVALHINPRLPQNYIVRNTKVNNIWGGEEVSSALPFSLHRGQNFSIQILITKECYMISVNGNHFAMYNHRLPFNAVRTFEVKGDVDNVEMTRSQVEEYPTGMEEYIVNKIRTDFWVLPYCRDSIDGSVNNTEVASLENSEVEDETSSLVDRKSLSTLLWSRRSTVRLLKRMQSKGELSMPFYGSIELGSLSNGRCLLIEGRTKVLPHSFYINLQRGAHFWPHPLIAFHFNPRFSKQSGAIGKAIVCRNAWYNGSWGREERSELDTDFRPGKNFKMLITCTPSCFEVNINNKLVTQFDYQIKPDLVDTVYIQGDIKLWDVVLKNTCTSSTRKRLITNPFSGVPEE